MGGQGGAGANATPGAGSTYQVREKRAGTAFPPPLEPTRPIYEVDCTKPFDPAGKGNLRCM